MLPTEWSFYFVLLAICIAYYAIPLRGRRVFLLLVNYVLYSLWDWRFTGLLAVVTILLFWGGLQMERVPTHKNKFLVLCGISSIGVLCVFKYLGFFIENLNQLFLALRMSYLLPVVKLAAPIGLSFFIFQVFGYAMDVWKGKIKAEHSLVDFALFVSFFPNIS